MEHVEPNPESEPTRNELSRGPEGLPLGRPFGIPVFADFSLLVAFGLIAVSLGTGVLPEWHPAWAPGMTWTVALGAAVLFFGSVLLHELAHAVVARMQGSSVRGITLFMFGGFTQIETDPRTPGAEFVMAIVGPLTSIVLGVGVMAIGSALGSAEAAAGSTEEVLMSLGPLPTLFLWLGPVNVVLGLFNLLPGFPLDGGRVLRAILWKATGSLTVATQWAGRMGEVFAWMLIATGVLMAFGWRIPVLGGGLFQGLWLTMIGWLLVGSARAGVGRVLARHALEGVPVKALMYPRITSVPPDLTVGELVREHLLGTDQRCFPVVSPVRFLGLVCLGDVRGTPPSSWDQVRVDAVMTPADRIGTLGPDDDAARALDELALRNVDQLPVLDRGRLVGFVRRRDLVQWLGLRAGAAAGRSRSHASSTLRPRPT